MKVQKLRRAKKIKVIPVSRHLVFYGNPGTGKTTVARLISRIYRSLSVLSKGQLIETDRSGLVAGYVGQTALRVQEIVKRALGGILFIDEAYMLSSDMNEDFGAEAIATLIKLMEDHRDDLIVIVAGYTDKMNQFLSANPGIRSRFNKYLSFDDYSPTELVAIFKSFCSHACYRLTTPAENKLLEIFAAFYDQRDETFGNARLARNIFERSISRQANRVVMLNDINDDILCTIQTEDLPSLELQDMAVKR